MRNPAEAELIPEDSPVRRAPHVVKQGFTGGNNHYTITDGELL